METPIAWEFFGASTRGPSHARDRLRSQDSWLGRQNATGTMIVVCDGLGSHAYPKEGSQQGCRAVAQACRVWWKSKGGSVERFLKLVHAIWPLYVSPFEPRECATTCLFAAVHADGRLVVAQLGDGMALIAKPGSETVVLAPDKHKAGEFANETTGLGLATSLDDWRWWVEAEVPRGTKVLLTTDGISEDLDPAKLTEVVKFVHRRYAELEPRPRWQALSGHLRDWPVPRHSDDKTLALLWSR